MIYEASPSLEPLAERLRTIDPKKLERAMSLVGVLEAGDPIRVALSDERSDLAARVPPWISGFAVAEQSALVIFPARLPSYPDSSLEEVLLHELAHVLIGRAAAHRPVPRWFDEGVAMIAGSPWGLADRWRVSVALVADRRPSLAELEQHFEGNENAAMAAYALAGAFTQDLMQRHGQRVAAEILAALARDVEFPAAFGQATGVSMAEAEDSFWRRYAFWYRWLPVLTSGATLWTGISLLTLVAIHRRRRRDAAQRRTWQEEELAELEQD